MRKIKKVLFVLSIYKPNMGGVETSVESYCREYNKRGIETVVLTKKFPENFWIFHKGVIHFSQLYSNI